MTRPEEFVPRLGRIGDRGKAGGKRALRQLQQAVARQHKPARKSTFTGARYGVGGSARTKGRTTDHLARHRMRRVIVKRHIARAGKSGPGLYRAHLGYLQRDGVDRSGDGGKLYDRNGEAVDVKAFLERSEDDRHQFRLIVSPEDGAALGDLKPVTRELMAQLERDLGARVDWVAVDHHNTGHPHTHIVMRGRDFDGRDLVIARDYLLHGIREAAEDIVTQRLGPRRDLEIQRARQSEVAQDRMTAIDHALERAAETGNVHIGPAVDDRARFERHLKLSRLRHLESLALAQQTGPETWRLNANWTETLKALGRRGDIIRTMAQAEGREAPDVKLAGDLPATAPPVTGVVLTYGPEDELRDTRFLLVRDFDDQVWHVPAAAIDAGNAPPVGAVVQLTRADAEPKRADRTIAEIAERSGGVWSETLHAETDPGSTQGYRLAHKRRLEALRRVAIAERMADGSWQVPDDYLERAAAYEVGRSGGLKLKTLSWMSMDAQVTARAETWLDNDAARDARLDTQGRARLAFLKEAGLVESGSEGLSASQRDALRQKELRRVADAQAAKSGRTLARLEPGDQFDGRLERHVDLAQGRMAIIGNEKAFVMVPWRDGLGPQIGRQMSISGTERGLRWTMSVTRGRGIS